MQSSSVERTIFTRLSFRFHFLFPHVITYSFLFLVRFWETWWISLRLLRKYLTLILWWFSFWMVRRRPNNVQISFATGDFSLPLILCIIPTNPSFYCRNAEIDDSQENSEDPVATTGRVRMSEEKRRKLFLVKYSSFSFVFFSWPSPL